MSPIAGVLVDRIGIRTTTFIGGFIATNSLLISSYFTHQVSYNMLLFHLQFFMDKQITITYLKSIYLFLNNYLIITQHNARYILQIVLLV